MRIPFGRWVRMDGWADTEEALPEVSAEWDMVANAAEGLLPSSTVTAIWLYRFNDGSWLDVVLNDRIVMRRYTNGNWRAVIGTHLYRKETTCSSLD